MYPLGREYILYNKMMNIYAVIDYKYNAIELYTSKGWVLFSYTYNDDYRLQKKKNNTGNNDVL